MAENSETLPGERQCPDCGGGGSVNGPNDALVTCPACNGDGYLIGPAPLERLPYHAVVTINSLVHLVQLRWDGYEDMIPALNDDDLAALNACFGTDWGDRGMGWDCERPAAVTIRELGEAQADTDDPYWQSLAELHASRKCPDCGGPFDHVLGQCRGRVADGPPSEASRRAVQTIIDATRRQMAEDAAGPVTRIEYPGEVVDDETAKALRAVRMSDDPDDLFVGRTSNATVGTIEVDRCSDDDCPVCGDE